ncbi:MAG: hypothetical protein OEY14_09440, partial [Myxococcales bacterium]|nr:hypothetical protein [Myxococcales bacterium]
MDRLVAWFRSSPEPHEDGEACAERSRWALEVAERLVAIRGRRVASIGGSVVALFDPPDLEAAMRSALEILEESESAESLSALGSLRASFGFAMGEVLEEPSPEGGVRWIGSCIDRAQLLANRARPGELVLDPLSQEEARRIFLFSRRVGSERRGLAGMAVDREHGLREDARRSLAALGPIRLPEILDEALADVRALAVEPLGCDLAVLRAPPGAGALAWLAALERELSPPLVLRCDPVPGGLEPLGSLRLALLSCWGSPEALLARLGEGPEAVDLARIAGGLPVRRAGVARAFRWLLEDAARGGRRAWVLLPRGAGLDASTLELLGATRRAAVPVFLVALAPVHGDLPRKLLAGSAPVDRVVPALRAADGRLVAEGLLGDADEGVLSRAGVLGGETLEGVVEVVRMLVSSGELIRDAADGRFRWRLRPRSGLRALPFELVLDERLHALDSWALRALEPFALAPEGYPRSVIEAVLRYDGMDESIRARSLERLIEEQLLDAEGLRLRSARLRRHVVGQMPPARLAELRRFFARALQTDPFGEGDLAEASTGYFLAEGGQSSDGAKALLHVALTTAEMGWARSSVRLAAVA